MAFVLPSLTCLNPAKLTSKEQVLLNRLMVYGQIKDGRITNIFPLNDTLARELGVTKRTIQRHLKSLEEKADLITVTIHKNRRSMEISLDAIDSYLDEGYMFNPETNKVIKLPRLQTRPSLASTVSENVTPDVTHNVTPKSDSMSPVSVNMSPRGDTVTPINLNKLMLNKNNLNLSYDPLIHNPTELDNSSQESKSNLSCLLKHQEEEEKKVHRPANLYQQAHQPTQEKLFVAIKPNTPEKMHEQAKAEALGAIKSYHKPQTVEAALELLPKALDYLFKNSQIIGSRYSKEELLAEIGHRLIHETKIDMTEALACSLALAMNLKWKTPISLASKRTLEARKREAENEARKLAEKEEFLQSGGLNSLCDGLKQRKNPSNVALNPSISPEVGKSVSQEIKGPLNENLKDSPDSDKWEKDLEIETAKQPSSVVSQKEAKPIEAFVSIEGMSEYLQTHSPEYVERQKRLAKEEEKAVVTPTVSQFGTDLPADIVGALESTMKKAVKTEADRQTQVSHQADIMIAYYARLAHQKKEALKAQEKASL